MYAIVRFKLFSDVHIPQPFEQKERNCKTKTFFFCKKNRFDVMSILRNTIFIYTEKKILNGFDNG